MIPGKKVQRISPSLLKKFSEGCYVDSPVYFEDRAWVRWLNWAKLERLYAMMPRGERARLLDFACGNGVMFPSWEADGKMAVGIDRHVTAADRVRKRGNLRQVHLAKSEGTFLPFRSESFDLVFAASVLEHFPELELPLAEIRRVLRRGGQMLFLCPNENGFYDRVRRLAGYRKPPDHYHTADEVLSHISRFFSLEEVTTYPGRVPSALAIYKLGRGRKN